MANRTDVEHALAANDFEDRGGGEWEHDDGRLVRFDWKPKPGRGAGLRPDEARAFLFQPEGEQPESFDRILHLLKPVIAIRR